MEKEGGKDGLKQDASAGTGPVSSASSLESRRTLVIM